MSGSHEKLPKLFWIQIILVVIVGTMFLLAPKATKHTAEASSTNSAVKTAAQNLAPVGEVVAKKDNAGGNSGAAKSGEAIYKETCQTCHATGIANAPKLDDKAAWEPRVASGLDGLLKTSISGKGAMPPKGGNMALSDEEMKRVVLYMAKQAGFDLSAAPEKTEAVPKKEDKEEAVAEPVVTEAPTPPAAPAAPAAPEVKTPEPVAIAATVEAPAAPAAVETPAAPAAVVEKPATPAAADNSAAGEKIYKSSCFACHDAGVAGSPKIGDAAAWSARIATGKDALYNSSLNGKGVMPPKGGNMGLSDDDVKAAVDYIVSKSK